MSYTSRIYFRDPFHGRRRQNMQLPGIINADSVVVITATEYNPADTVPGHDQERRRFLGDANIWISNISPHGDGSPNYGVEFAINVDWGSPLYIAIDITVLDPPANVSYI